VTGTVECDVLLVFPQLMGHFLYSAKKEVTEQQQKGRPFSSAAQLLCAGTSKAFQKEEDPLLPTEYWSMLISRQVQGHRTVWGEAFLFHLTYQT